MEYHAGIDVSLELSSICVVDATGKRRAFGRPPQPLTAGDWHGFPDRLDLARQRLARFMGDGGGCMGSFLRIGWHPTPLVDGSDDSLATLVDMDVLDADPLLAFAPMLIEGEHQVGVGAGELRRVSQVVLPASEGLATWRRGSGCSTGVSKHSLRSQKFP
jgi:hypothetical protein